MKEEEKEPLKEESKNQFPEAKSQQPEAGSQLNTDNPHKITYTTQIAIYYIKGGIPKALDSLKVTLEIENPGIGRKYRIYKL